MNYFFTITFLLLMFFNVNGQQSQYHFLDYKWQNGAVSVNDSKSHHLSFEFQTSDHLSKIHLSIINPVYIPCDSSEINYIKNFLIDSIPHLSYQSGISRKHLIIKGEVFPFILKDNHYQKLIFAGLQLITTPLLLLENQMLILNTLSFQVVIGTSLL